MWTEYKLRFIFTEIAIVAFALLLHFMQHYPWPATAMAFAMLQVFAFLGARWSVRMKRKLLAERPLLRPRG